MASALRPSASAFQPAQAPAEPHAEAQADGLTSYAAATECLVCCSDLQVRSDA